MTLAGQPQMLLVGRLLLAALVLVAGIGKLMGAAAAAADFAMLGFPVPEAMIWL
ncbi:MAG: DoxX family membrane protein, partial [Burkholderiales bacterium]